MLQSGAGPLTPAMGNATAMAWLVGQFVGTTGTEEPLGRAVTLGFLALSALVALCFRFPSSFLVLEDDAPRLLHWPAIAGRRRCHETSEGA